MYTKVPIDNYYLQEIKFKFWFTFHIQKYINIPVTTSAFCILAIFIHNNFSLAKKVLLYSNYSLFLLFNF